MGGGKKIVSTKIKRSITYETEMIVEMMVDE